MKTSKMSAGGNTATRAGDVVGEVLVTGVPGMAARIVVDQFRAATSAGQDRLEVIEYEMPGGESGLQSRRIEAVNLGRIRAVIHLSLDNFHPNRLPLHDALLRGSLGIAERASVPFYYVTSAFARAEGATGTRSATAIQGHARTVSETLSGSDVPHTLIRTSMLIGHSRDGSIGEFPAIYRAFAAILAGGLSLDLLDPQGLVDCIPCDVVGDVIAKLLANKVTDREIWLTQGESALTVDETIAVVQQFDSEYGTIARQRAYRISRPVPALVSVFANISRRDPLESSLGDRFQTALGELGAIGAPSLADSAETLIASLHYWASSMTSGRDAAQPAA